MSADTLRDLGVDRFYGSPSEETLDIVAAAFKRRPFTGLNSNNSTSTVQTALALEKCFRHGSVEAPTSNEKPTLEDSDG